MKESRIHQGNGRPSREPLDFDDRTLAQQIEDDGWEIFGSAVEQIHPSRPPVWKSIWFWVVLVGTSAVLVWLVSP